MVVACRHRPPPLEPRWCLHWSHTPLGWALSHGTPPPVLAPLSVLLRIAVRTVTLTCIPSPSPSPSPIHCTRHTTSKIPFLVERWRLSPARSLPRHHRHAHRDFQQNHLPPLLAFLLRRQPVVLWSLTRHSTMGACMHPAHPTTGSQGAPPWIRSVGRSCCQQRTTPLATRRPHPGNASWPTCMRPPTTGATRYPATSPAMGHCQPTAPNPMTACLPRSTHYP